MHSVTINAVNYEKISNLFSEIVKKYENDSKIMNSTLWKKTDIHHVSLEFTWKLQQISSKLGKII